MESNDWSATAIRSTVTNNAPKANLIRTFPIRLPFHALPNLSQSGMVIAKKQSGIWGKGEEHDRS